MTLQKRVPYISRQNTGWGKASLELNEDGISFSQRSFVPITRDETQVAFDEISRVLYGNVHPDITPLYFEERYQHGLLILRKPRDKYVAPLAFITGSDTDLWVNMLHDLSPKTHVECIVESFKTASMADVYDIEVDKPTPHVTHKIAAAGTLMLTDESINFCSWPAYQAASYLKWKDIESIVIPEMTYKMLDEVFFDYCENKFDEPIGFILKHGIKQIPGYRFIDNGFKILKAITELGKYFSKAGTFLIKPYPGVNPKISHLGKPPDVVIVSVSNIKRCLNAAKEFIHKSE